MKKATNKDKKVAERPVTPLDVAAELPCVGGVAVVPPLGGGGEVVDDGGTAIGGEAEEEGGGVSEVGGGEPAWGAGAGTEAGVGGGVEG